MDEEERSENEEEELTENSTISQIKKKKTKKSKKKKKSPTSSVKNSHELFRQLSYYVKETNDHGRYAVAKDTIPLGRCVLREQPYQVMSSGKLCMKCGKSISNGNTEVSQFHYCSNSCQSSFENNYVSCITSQVSKIRELCEVHDCSTDLVLISLLILFTQHFQTVESSDCLFQLIGNYVLSTPLGCQNQVSHLAMQNSEWVAALRGVFDSLLFGTFSTLFERERDIQILDVILEIAAKVNSNSYGIYDDFANDKPFLGFGVFPVAAMTINHSCRPNLINIYFDGKMEYRSIREIQKDEELTVSYINCLQGFTKRREELVTTRLFQCRCTRCYNHEQVLLRPHVSPNLSTDLMADLMLDGLHCNTCGMDYHTATVFKSLIGPSGVVLLSLTVPQQCYCIQCHQQVDLY